jgi:hypothetical protein
VSAYEPGDSVLTPLGPGQFVRALAEDDYLVEVGSVSFTVTPDLVLPLDDQRELDCEAEL